MSKHKTKSKTKIEEVTVSLEDYIAAQKRAPPVGDDIALTSLLIARSAGINVIEYLDYTWAPCLFGSISEDNFHCLISRINGTRVLSHSEAAQLLSNQRASNKPSIKKIARAIVYTVIIKMGCRISGVFEPGDSEEDLKHKGRNENDTQAFLNSKVILNNIFVMADTLSRE